MLTDERHAKILKMLDENGIVKTQELMDVLQCSESTIRRDLDHLEKLGKLKRVHGGAKRIYQLDEELSNQEKSLKNIQEKVNIGKYAASLVEENDFIFIDAGTTTLKIIDFLEKENIKIVTNGISHALLLADRNIDAILIGGRIKPSTKAVVGATSLDELKDFRFNKSFIGINGIHTEFGCTTPDSEEAAIKRLVIHHSAIPYVLADESKWDKVNFTKVCELEDVSIITNKTKKDLTAYKEKTTILEVN